eukprot:g46464.t1
MRMMSRCISSVKPKGKRQQTRNKMTSGPIRTNNTEKQAGAPVARKSVFFTGYPGGDAYSFMTVNLKQKDTIRLRTGDLTIYVSPSIVSCIQACKEFEIPVTPYLQSGERLVHCTSSSRTAALRSGLLLIRYGTDLIIPHPGIKQYFRYLQQFNDLDKIRKPICLSCECGSIDTYHRVLDTYYITFK